MLIAQAAKVAEETGAAMAWSTTLLLILGGIAMVITLVVMAFGRKDKPQP